MAQVIHTCDVIYGSYDGQIDVVCDEDDDMETIKGKVRRQANLNFLSMATYSVKIINTKQLRYEEEDY